MLFMILNYVQFASQKELNLLLSNIIFTMQIKFKVDLLGKYQFYQSLNDSVAAYKLFKSVKLI